MAKDSSEHPSWQKINWENVKNDHGPEFADALRTYHEENPDVGSWVAFSRIQDRFHEEARRAITATNELPFGEDSDDYDD